MYNAQFKTMLKLIAIDLMLLLVNFFIRIGTKKVQISPRWGQASDIRQC